MEIAIGWLGWVIRGDTHWRLSVEKYRAADRLRTAGSMRVESPTATMRPLQPPLARVLWCSKVGRRGPKKWFSVVLSEAHRTSNAVSS
jgi:hypothetical protein